MLRITTIYDCGNGAAVTLKLEGKLLQPWIAELQEAYREARRHATCPALDLAGVSFVDVPGTIALRDLKRRGIFILGCSPLIAELLKEND